MGRKNQNKKLIGFRASTTTQELIERYCTKYNTTTTEAIEQLIELGTLLDLSNEYNTTSSSPSRV